MMEEKEKAVLMLTIVLLRRHYHGKATMAQRFLRRREGQTAHIGRAAAQPVKPLYYPKKDGKSPLFSRTYLVIASST